MTGYLLYLFGIVFVAVWAFLRRRTSVRWLLACWGIGVLLIRVVPSLWAILFHASSLGLLPRLTGWIGTIVLLRAFAGLTAWGRTRSRRTWIWLALLLTGMIIGGWPSMGAFVLLIIPWLLSVRWRWELGGTGLFVASLIGLVSLFLCGVSFGPAMDLRAEAALPGLTRLWGIGSAIGAAYGALMMAATAALVHLSIRRIGRRLLVSHLMAGVIPVCLVAIFLVLSSTLFLSTYRSLVSQRVLASAGRDAEAALARGIGLPLEDSASPFGPRSRGQIVMSRTDGGPVEVIGSALRFSPDSLLAAGSSSRDVPFLWDGAGVYIRARVDTTLEGRNVQREALAPLDSLGMVVVSGLLGIPVRVNPEVRVERSGKGVTISPAASDSATIGDGSIYYDASVRHRGPIGPPQPGGLQLPGGAVARCIRWAPGKGFSVSALPVFSSAGVTESITALVSIARENPVAIIVLLALSLTAVLFIAAVWITISMVVAMARSITRSVQVLSGATAELREGNLDHRIVIEGEDELWRVAGSFNEMAEGLGRMREMELTNERLEEELRVARRIQERLLPERPPTLDRLELAGLSLPARHVGGDYFDYIPIDGGRRVAIAVADVSGKGVGAALLMSSFRASLRSQDLDHVGPRHVAEVLNRFVCASVDPGKFITAFIATVDPGTGDIRYVNAGHEPPILMSPEGAFSSLDRGGLIMGAFAQAEYEEGTVNMPAGGLLAIFTDGVTEARNSAGAFLGDEPLRLILRSSGREACPQILKRVVSTITSFAGEEPQSDDITLLLARRT